ncbi:hypothetical protein F5Y04DRAFT_289435 [Hypomontagnella monticulosa]|nr:hypothetical protein F5Y04DRAFT_289435 [Hypomontagnella monticulosa]
MDHMLRCNSLKCRKELRDRALVTTCCHIFCIECAARLGLTGQGHEQRNSCPACRTHLTNPDDAVISNLNPSEDYKTSVLSGLSPHIIIECASRALSFWAYQATQEVIFQEHLGKALTEKYSNLSVHLDKVINDANSQITSLQDKLTRNLRRKNDELVQAYKEKTRKLLQTQELYDKLKRKAMLGQMQDAAESAAESVLHGSPSSGPRFEGGGQYPIHYQEQGTPYVSNSSAFHEQQEGSAGFQHQTAGPTYETSWPRPAGTQSNIPVTPSTHRQRIGDPAGIGLSTIPGLVVGTPRIRQASMNVRTTHEGAPSNNFQGNTRMPAMGLSSGLKANYGGGETDGFPAPTTRPRVAQRQTPISSAYNQRSTGGQSTLLGGIRSGFTNR